MNVLLIAPPRFHMLESPGGSSYDEIEGFYPPLGLMYLASYLRENTSHEVEILDAQVEKLNYEDISRRIRESGAGVVGIQTTSFTIMDAILTARAVKEVDSSIHVCLGGPHVSIYPEETIRLPEVDSIVLGEGEIIFSKLVDCLEKGHDPGSVPGLVFRRGETVVNTGPGQAVNDLDLLPFPARDLLPVKKYYSPVDSGAFLTTMITSRGCPYNCLFCYDSKRKYRVRSAGNVLDEMESCVSAGIKDIYIFDDTFIIQRERVLEIIDGIADRGLELDWSFRGRVDRIDRELADRLRSAGCRRINFGVEVGSQEILRIMRKGVRLEQVKEAFKITRGAGIITIAFFMLGFAGETREHVLRTIDFALELDSDFVVFSITTPYPATDLYSLGLEKGIIKKDYWREFALDPTTPFIPGVWEEHLSRDELLQLLRFANRKFYMRPAYLARRLASVRSFKEFKRNILAGVHLLTG